MNIQYPGCLGGSLIKSASLPDSVHNPELNHHDQARQAKMLFRPCHTIKKYSWFSFIRCFLQQSRRREVRQDVSWTIVTGCDVACSLATVPAASHWLVPPDSELYNVTRTGWRASTVTDCFLQFLSLILSSQCVVTSLLFAHFCFTPFPLSQRRFPNPWWTLPRSPLCM